LLDVYVFYISYLTFVDEFCSKKMIRKKHPNSVDQIEQI
jgi:hypothetical protein